MLSFVHRGGKLLSMMKHPCILPWFVACLNAKPETFRPSIIGNSSETSPRGKKTNFVKHC